MSQSFAQTCLRTLCVAVRCVPEELWECWSKVLTDAATMATGERDAVLEALHGDMESQLLVGSCWDVQMNRWTDMSNRSKIFSAVS